MFSIIIPTYKRETELLKLLDSLNNQEYKNFEAIVVNDDPTSKLIIDNNLYEYPIEYVVNIKNFGPAKSRNIGINIASREWLVFCDDDDSIMSNKLNILYHVINMNKDINFIVHKGKINLINEKITYKTNNSLPRSTDEILVYNCIGGTPFVTLKKMLLESEKFDFQLSALEDYDLWIRLVKSNKIKPYLVNEYLVECNYYSKKKSVSKNIQNNIESWNMITEKYQSQVKNLSYKKQMLRKSYYYSMIGYKYLLNYNKKASLIYFKAFFWSLKPKFLLISLISLFSIKSVFKFRGEKQ